MYFQITEEVKKNVDRSLGQVLLCLQEDFKRSYSDPYVRKLCLWWAFAFGAYVQVEAIKIFYSFFFFIFLIYKNIN